MASALSNRQNCACARKTLHTQKGRTHGAGCVRQWFRTAEPLGERRYENWNTHIHTHTSDGLLVLALYTGSRGFDSHRGTCPYDFSDPIDQDIRTQLALSWKIVGSEWRSVIAVSLNVGGGVRLIKPAKLYMCTQNTTNEDGRTAPGVAAMVPYR